jgi:xylan 1,4-beta-xylosidase
MKNLRNTMHPRTLHSVAIALAGILLASSVTLSAQTSAPGELVIDAHAATTPFPHFWEQTFGSGRAILALRADYRQDLHTVKQATPASPHPRTTLSGTA